MTKLVWLDAGHGGPDPGAVGNGLRESDIVLELALRTGAYLLATFNNVNVRYSRTTNVFLTLAQRTNAANAANADVFVSFHCNAASNPQANGYEDFIFNGTLRANDSKLQQDVHRSVWAFYQANGIRTNRGMKRQNLHVVRETKMAAVLTENLFMSNPEILNFRNNAFLQGVAVAHAEGIATFLGLTRKSSTSKAPSTTTATTTPVITASAATTTQTAQTSNNNFYPRSTAGGDSITAALNAINVDSSYANRTRIANANGIANYTGSSSQNIALVRLLNQGKLINPAARTTSTTTAAATTTTSTATATSSTTSTSTAAARATTTNFYPATTAGGGSITAALAAIKVDSSFANRKRIAAANGISSYTGTASQNTALLRLLNQGRLVNPGATSTATAAATPKVNFYPRTTAGGASLTAALNAINVNSSFANRNTIARANGITNYTGTAAQNTSLLRLLNQGKLIRP